MHRSGTSAAWYTTGVARVPARHARLDARYGNRDRCVRLSRPSGGTSPLQIYDASTGSPTTASALSWQVTSSSGSGTRVTFGVPVT